MKFQTFDRSVQARIEENSKDSDAFKGDDIFRSLLGKGKGIWYLKSYFKKYRRSSVRLFF